MCDGEAGVSAGPGRSFATQSYTLPRRFSTVTCVDTTLLKMGNDALVFPTSCCVSSQTTILSQNKKDTIDIFVIVSIFFSPKSDGTW